MRSYLWNWQKWSIRDEQNYYKGKEKDSYGIQRGKIDGFSCGNRLQVEINGEWVDTHMEMDWSTGKGIWYLTGTDLKGSALENKRVRVLRDR